MKEQTDISMVERTNVSINIPESYIDFTKYLQTIKVRAYFVGGCVRDALLGIESQDFDLFCLCSKEDFKRKNEKYEEVVDFDRVLILYDDEEFEYFTMSFAESFEEDYLGRDFTINSIYYDWTCKRVFGYKGSFDDLEAGIIRPTNEKSFKQDDLKQLRAIRFENKLHDFMVISEYNLFRYNINFKSIDTKFKALRLRNEFFKHKVSWLGRYDLISKIVDKLKEFDIDI